MMRWSEGVCRWVLGRGSPSGSGRRQRNLVAGSLLLLGLAVSIFIFGLDLLDFRTDKEKIRDVAADFVEACRDRDLDDILDLHSTASRRKAAEFLREECRRSNISLPQDLADEALFHHFEEAPHPAEPTLLAAPWRWPTEWLDDLRLDKVEIDPTDSFLLSNPKRKREAEATLRFRGNRYGAFQPYDIRLVFVRDGRRWRIDHLSIRTFEMVEGFSPPPGIRRGKTDDGRPYLAARIGFDASEIPPRDLASTLTSTSAETMVRLEVREDIDIGTLAPWLLAVAEAGRPEVVLRSCRDSSPRRDYIIWVMAGWGGQVSQQNDGKRSDLLVEIPGSVPGLTLVLPVEKGGPPQRLELVVPGEMRFRTIPPEAGPLRDRLAAAAKAGDPPAPLLDAAAGTSIWKLVAVWREICELEATPVLLALPGPGDAESRMLRRAQ